MKAPVKIALVNAEWLPVPPVLGGAVEKTLYDTALAIRDPELSVISPWVEELARMKPAPPGIFHHVDIQAEKARIHRLLKNRLPPRLKCRRTARRAYYLCGLSDVIQRLAPDFIQIHNRTTFVPYLLKEFPNIPIILYLHNRLGHAGLPLEQSLVRKLHRLVFVSRYLQQEYLARYPECASRSTVIYNSIDINTWHPDVKTHPETRSLRRRYALPPGKTVLFVGRLVEEKGIMNLLEAMGHVTRKMPEANLVVAGSPFFKISSASPFYTRLKKRAAELETAVQFIGHIDHEQTPYLFANADITVVPSLRPEGFCKVVTESMATGVPVIANRTGAIPELITHEETGILIDEPTNTPELARQIIHLLADADRRSTMGRNARKRVATYFTPDIRIAHLRAFYQSL